MSVALAWALCCYCANIFYVVMSIYVVTIFLYKESSQVDELEVTDWTLLKIFLFHTHKKQTHRTISNYTVYILITHVFR